ncbi:MAG: ORF6N domain-containing protein [Candidatus Omnitrophica bacterium]|nr:ORF6N domain-containing protein [Candidatus Omnitrophota bacterium]
MKNLIPQEVIERRIFVIRGQKVMLDRDLAKLYGVPTKVLNQAVKRNISRFPQDFMFQLSTEEMENWRSQIVTSNREKMGIRRKPYAFTEHGILMLSSVLNSERAVQVNIAIMRAFVRLKQVLATHKELAGKLKELEGEVGKHNKLIIEIFEIIRQLTPPPLPPPKPKGGRNLRPPYTKRGVYGE